MAKKESNNAIRDIVWYAPSDIKPNPKNRNKHSDAQIERLAEIIKYQGWRHPLIVSKRSNLLVVGHGRLEAAKKLGLKFVPVSTQEFDSEDQERAFGVSDNAIASWAELDLSGINLDIPDFGPDFDINMLGLKDFEIEPADKYGDKELDENLETKNQCPSCGYVWG